MVFLRRRLWVCLLVAALGASMARAGTLLFDRSASSTFQDGRVTASVVVTNRGDEPAISVRIEAALGDTRALSPDCDVLDPGQAMKASFDLGPAPALPGGHTVILMIRYSDVAGHSFAVPASVPVFTAGQDPRPSRVQASLIPTRLAGPRASARLTLEARSNTAARVTLVLPEELGGPLEPRHLDLVGGVTALCEFPLRNRNAVPGSRYQILAVVDYEEEGLHRSQVIPGAVEIPRPWLDTLSPAWMLVILLPLLLAYSFRQFPAADPFFERLERPAAALRGFVPGACFSILLLFLLWHFPIRTLLLDTTCTGGDTPAHNYLARHLSQQLFQHGRVVSWAHGWWAGFPMFQYYFPLPYILIALLDLVLPFNLAFKLVSILGIVLLPPAALVFGRLLRLPPPIPVLLAMAMIPFLFVRTHTMWGVNIYSTLAGMLANSLSFPIMLLFVGSAYRDSEDGRFRLRTVIALAVLVLSHFFTSVVAGITLLILPFLRPASGFRRSLGVLAAEAACGLLLVAGWLIPLLVKAEFSVDFGQNWDLQFHRTFPLYTLALFPFIGIALAVTFIRSSRPLMMLEWMFLVAVVLFHHGFALSPVFVNVRLWPFIFFGLLALAAAGLGFLLTRLRGRSIGLAIVLAAILGWGIDAPNHVRQWVTWNQEGLEAKPGWPVFEQLVLPLDRTPGRLAYDLHPDNNALGSSRVFETVPALIDKPILEGGIVNSAVGSMYAYYIQGESSRACAGFPDLVQPAAFNITNATRHLELFNVKHFIARSTQTREAMTRSPHWKSLATCQRWELFELTTHAGRQVFIPRHEPVPIRVPATPGGRAWKQASLDWMYRIEARDQPFILLSPDEPAPTRSGPVLDPAAYRASLDAIRDGIPPPFEARPLAEAGTSAIVTEALEADGRIRFTTTAPGRPHIVKCNYFPNWKVRGAPRVHRVTPNFILVYPDGADVVLYYGSTVADNAGRLISLGMALALAGWGIRAFRRRARPFGCRADGESDGEPDGKPDGER